MMKNKVIKTIYTQDMHDDLVSFEGIDAVQMLEDILAEELYKTSPQGKIEAREKKIDELLDENTKED